MVWYVLVIPEYSITEPVIIDRDGRVWFNMVEANPLSDYDRGRIKELVSELETLIQNIKNYYALW